MSIKVNGKVVAGRGKPGIGIPTGGAQGQVLIKRSSKNYDTEWGAVSADGDIIIGGGGGETYTAGRGIDITDENVIDVQLPTKPLTLEEYNALSEEERNSTEWVYIITDDTTASGELIEGVVSFNGREGVVVPQTGDYTADMVGALPDTTVIPSKVSELTNDSNFVTNKELQDAVDSLEFSDGLPTGGTTGQVLTKKSATDYDAEWTTPATDGVTSFNGRSGAVVPQNGDYTATQVGAVDATNGTAPYATQLKNARTVRTNLASTSTASFNGTANITPGVTGTLPIANGGTGVTTLAALKTNLGIDELKTSVSNGKSAIASAITDKGVSTSATADFSTMAANISKISTGVEYPLKVMLYNQTVSPAGSVSVSNSKIRVTQSKVDLRNKKIIFVSISYSKICVSTINNQSNLGKILSGFFFTNTLGDYTGSTTLTRRIAYTATLTNTYYSSADGYGLRPAIINVHNTSAMELSIEVVSDTVFDIISKSSGFITGSGTYQVSLVYIDS